MNCALLSQFPSHLSCGLSTETSDVSSVTQVAVLGFSALREGGPLPGVPTLNSQAREQHVSRATPLGSSLSGFCRALHLKRRGEGASPVAAVAASGMGLLFSGPASSVSTNVYFGSPSPWRRPAARTPRSPGALLFPASDPRELIFP
ncbi:hypothetical protein HPB50_001805 [Hyalomma asiaticum]|uniref:Uncharacterized protein n=1 Tax=Hyalomma asiaticum TaxID=266040 RepID=A0ACB7TGX3_HYAAI|nr:hypothetical protein HPB50_001805 [Hyalomma asiaticum]